MAARLNWPAQMGRGRKADIGPEALPRRFAGKYSDLARALHVRRKDMRSIGRQTKITFQETE